MEGLIHLGLFCLFAQQVLCLSDEAKLMEELLSRYREEYTRYTRPVEASGDTLEVELGMSLIDVQDFEFDTGRGEFYMFDKWSWIDTHLEWKPSDYGGLTKLRMPVEKIWTPDMVVYDNRDMNVDRMHSMVVVDSNGKVLWVPRSKYHQRCMEKYGVWVCGFKMGSWTYNGDMIMPKLYNNQSEIDTNDFKSNHRWEVIASDAKVNVVKYDCCEELYPNVYFELKIRSLTQSASGAVSAVSASACLGLMVVALGRALWL